MCGLRFAGPYGILALRVKGSHLAFGLSLALLAHHRLPLPPRTTAFEDPAERESLGYSHEISALLRNHDRLGSTVRANCTTPAMHGHRPHRSFALESLSWAV